MEQPGQTNQHLCVQEPSSKFKTKRKQEFQPRKPPIWVPEHLSFNCFSCEVEFGWLFTRAHHCRNCGRCFCEACCSNMLPIKEFGYFKPTRVCGLCKPFVEFSLAKEAKRNAKQET